MASSEHIEGLNLLNKWRNTEALIRVEFSDTAKSSVLNLFGRITDLTDTVLSFTSETFSLVLRMGDAEIDNVASRRVLESIGKAGAFPESLQIVVSSGDVFVFTGPREIKGTISMGSPDGLEIGISRGDHTP